MPPFIIAPHELEQLCQTIVKVVTLYLHKVEK